MNELRSSHVQVMNKYNGRLVAQKMPPDILRVFNIQGA